VAKIVSGRTNAPVQACADTASAGVRCLRVRVVLRLCTRPPQFDRTRSMAAAYAGPCDGDEGRVDETEDGGDDDATGDATDDGMHDGMHESPVAELAPKVPARHSARVPWNADGEPVAKGASDTSESVASRLGASRHRVDRLLR